MDREYLKTILRQKQSADPDCPGSESCKYDYISGQEYGCTGATFCPCSFLLAQNPPHRNIYNCYFMVNIYKSNLKRQTHEIFKLGFYSSTNFSRSNETVPQVFNFIFKFSNLFSISILTHKRIIFGFLPNMKPWL